MTKLVRRAPYDAKNSWTHASLLFKAAVAEGLITASPCASLDKRSLFKGKTPPRQRALSDEELQAFWTASGALDTPYQQFFRLLALTGVRLNELARARWPEVNPDLRAALREAARAGVPVNWAALPDDSKTWVVPKERFKSSRPHSVELSDGACAIVATLPRYSGSADYLFSTTGGSKPINGLSKAKKRLDARMLEHLRAAAVSRDEDPQQVQHAGWVLHDLRRTLRTNLAKLRVPFEVAETVLGHTLGGIHATYNIHTYQTEQREALTKWARRLCEITTPTPPAPSTATNVVACSPKQARSN
jgi:integrase